MTLTRRCALWYLLLLFLLTPLAAWGQVTYNPKTVEFTSPDHVALVSSYVMEYWLDGVDPATGSPVMVMTLPKAACVATQTANTYTAPLTALQPLPVLQVGRSYRATLTAVGMAPEEKSGRSALTLPFALASVPVTPSQVFLR